MLKSLKDQAMRAAGQIAGSRAAVEMMATSAFQDAMRRSLSVQSGVRSAWADQFETIARELGLVPAGDHAGLEAEARDLKARVATLEAALATANARADAAEKAAATPKKKAAPKKKAPAKAKAVKADAKPKAAAKKKSDAKPKAAAKPKAKPKAAAKKKSDAKPKAKAKAKSTS